MVKPAAHLYRFGEFELDAIRRVLLCGEKPVQLPSRAFDVLLALVEHSQYVIDKGELMRLVWGERIVEENNLTRHISTLRRALNESPDDHRYIVTVPGQGYSFVAPVERGAATAGRAGAATENFKQELAQRASGLANPAVELQPAARHSPGPTGTTGRVATTASHARRRKTWFWATAIVLVLAGCGLLGFRLVSLGRSPGPVKGYRDWEIVRLTRSGGSAAPDISRDGKYAAYVSVDSGLFSVWIVQIATSAQRQIVPPDNFVYFGLSFTADANELYFTRREGAAPMGSLYRVPVLGGVPKKLRNDLMSSPIVSPDGAHLAFTRRDETGKEEFIISNPDGVEERVLATHSLEFPAWAPDGNVLAYSVGSASSGAEDMGIQEIRLDNGVVRGLTGQKWCYLGHKSWLSDGTGLIVCGRELKSTVNRLWFVAYPSGEARPLSDDFDSFKHLTLAADGKTLVTEQISAASDIWSGPLEDVSSAKKVGVWGLDGLSLAPDGRIVYSSMQGGNGLKIWIMNSDGSDRKVLTTDNSLDISAAVSPDGRYILFASNRSGNFEIWRINLDGSNPVQLTNTTGANPPSITSDSKWVVFCSSEDHNLYRVPIEGGPSQRVAKDAIGMSAVSPDGNLIAYFFPGKDRWGVAVSSFHDGSVIRRFEAGSHGLSNNSLKWSPDGKALLYSVSSGGVANIWKQPLDGSPAKQVTDFKADGIFRFDVSRDGKNLICARGGWKHDVVLIENVR